VNEHKLLCELTPAVTSRFRKKSTQCFTAGAIYSLNFPTIVGEFNPVAYFENIVEIFEMIKQGVVIINPEVYPKNVAKIFKNKHGIYYLLNYHVLPIPTIVGEFKNKHTLFYCYANIYDNSLLPPKNLTVKLHTHEIIII